MNNESWPKIDPQQSDSSETESLEYGVPIPAGHHYPDVVKINEWLDLEADPRYRELKQKLVDNLNYIPFEEFVAALDMLAIEINERLREGQPYAVLWDESNGKSRRWVYELIEDKIILKPEVKSYTGPQSRNRYYKSIIEKGIDTFLIVDDASYGSSQIRGTMFEILQTYMANFPEKKPRIIIAVPYITQGGLDRIMNMRPDLLDTEVLKREIMPTLGEILSDEDRELIKERDEGLDPKIGGIGEVGRRLYESQTLTYFDHRYSDNESFHVPVGKAALNFGGDTPYSLDTPYSEMERKEFKEWQEKSS